MCNLLSINLITHIYRSVMRPKVHVSVLSGEWDLQAGELGWAR